MTQIIISNLFITFILIVPLLIKTLGVNNPFIDGLVNGLNPIYIFLILLNFIGMICLSLVSKYSKYISTSDLTEQNKENEKLENNIVYKIYKYSCLSLMFGLLMFNAMFLTTIFACIWRLTNHFFKINFDKFMKELEE